AGLEAYAREHGVQLRPSAAEGRSRAVPVRPKATRQGRVARFIERMGRPGRTPAAWAWAIGPAGAVAPTAAAHPAACCALAVRAVVVLAGAGVGWVVARALYWLVLLIANPVLAFLWLGAGVAGVVVAFALLVTAWVWASDIARGVMQL